MLLAQTYQAFLCLYSWTLRSVQIGSFFGFPWFYVIIYDIKLLWSNDNENPDDQRSQTELKLSSVSASVS